MKDSLENALEDILTIKNSIGETKSNYNTLFKLLLFVGTINLLHFASSTIPVFFLDGYQYATYFSISSILNTIFYIAFFIYFIKIYRQEKTSSNKYYLSLLTVFAGVTFLFPLFRIMIDILNPIPVANEKIESFVMQLQSFSQLSNILLLCLVIIICSYILKRKSMIVISSGIVFIYLLISLIYHDVEFGIGHSTTQSSAFITLLGIYYNLVTSIGYIVIAIVLKNGVNKTNGVN